MPKKRKKALNQTAEQLMTEYTQATDLHWCEWGSSCPDKELLESLADLWAAIYYARNPFPNNGYTNEGEWFV